MSGESVHFRVEGIAPLLMHNGQLANPLNPLVKEMKGLTSVRKKTDDTHHELSRLEFRAGLYLNQSGEVIIPSDVIESCLVEGAKKSKLGKQFKSAIMVFEDSVLDYGEKLTVDELWEQHSRFADVRGVKVGASRVMRTRPIFRQWSIEFTVTYEADLITAGELLKAAADAGSQVGLCDYRPKFGRFQIVE